LLYPDGFLTSTSRVLETALHVPLRREKGGLPRRRRAEFSCGDRRFESVFLHRRVRKLSVPLRDDVLVALFTRRVPVGHGPIVTPAVVLIAVAFLRPVMPSRLSSCRIALSLPCRKTAQAASASGSWDSCTRRRRPRARLTRASIDQPSYSENTRRRLSKSRVALPHPKRARKRRRAHRRSVHRACRWRRPAG
jgi:hypothetical protein